MAAVIVTWGEETSYVHSVDDLGHELDRSILPLYQLGPVEYWNRAQTAGSEYDASTATGRANTLRFQTVQSFHSWLADLDAHRKEWDDRWPMPPGVLEVARVKLSASETAEFDKTLQAWRARLLREGIVENAPDTEALLKRPPGVVDIAGKALETLPDAAGGSGISIKTLAVIALVGVGAYYAIGASRMLGVRKLLPG